MSFIRPEAAASLRRYGEPAVYGAVAVWGLWTGISLLWRGGWVGAVPLVLGVIAALGLLGAAERALVAWRSQRQGPGVVTIQEGRITYFGPLGGAVMALDALTHVDLVVEAARTDQPEFSWHIWDELGQRVSIPGGAENASDLLDRLSTLPGFDHRAVVTAMRSKEAARFDVWRRSRAGSQLAS